MRGYERHAFLVLLAALAGWLDAFSFTELGQVFTSFQSGNLIFLGLGVAQGDGERLLGAAVSLAAFVGGSAVGGYVVGRLEHDWSELRWLVKALLLECGLLIAFAVFWELAGEPGAYSPARIVLLGLAAAAMGVQGAAVFTLRIPGVVTNAMTATLMLGGMLLGLRARNADEAAPVSGRFVAMLCASYAVSALVVAAIDTPALTSTVPGVLLLLMLLTLTRRAAVVAAVTVFLVAAPAALAGTDQPAGKGCVGAEEALVRGAGDSGGSFPRLGPAIYRREFTLDVSLDGADGSELPISIEEVCDLPRSLRKKAALLAGNDGVALLLLGTTVWVGDEHVVGREAQTAIDGADTALLTVRLVRRSRWREDEDGNEVPTFRTRHLVVTD